MKKKRSDQDKEGIVWPANQIKEQGLKPSHHEIPGPPGSDHHHNEEARNKDRRRVWSEKNKQNLPNKKIKPQ
ncbi:MAG: hypothetical protein JSS07_01415 [Proteobacteria bacterium]|nr:hypothetical protein [Pseudomonadota bacterium]